MTSITRNPPITVATQRRPASDDQWAADVHEQCFWNGYDAAETAFAAGADSSEAANDAYFGCFKACLENRNPQSQQQADKLIEMVGKKLRRGAIREHKADGSSKNEAQENSEKMVINFFERCRQHLPTYSPRALAPVPAPAPVSAPAPAAIPVAPALAPAPAAPEITPAPAPAPAPLTSNEALAGSSDNETPKSDRVSKKNVDQQTIYGRKTWSGWAPAKSARPDQDAVNYLNARDNFKKATSTHSKILAATGIFLTGVGGVLVAPLAFSTISDLCKADAENPTGCRNSKFAAAGAVLICVAGIVTGFSLFVSDQRKQRRKKNYAKFHRGAKAV